MGPKMKKNALAHPAFSLIELLLILAVLAVLIGLAIPTVSTVSRNAKAQVCAAEMRDNMRMVQMYAQEHNDSIPFPISRAPQHDQRAPGWIGPGSMFLSDDEYLSVRGYWPAAMRHDFGNTQLHPALICPADRETIQLVQDAADRMNIDPSRVIYAQDRIISASMYADPRWCATDQPRWEISAADVATISDVRYPSSKAGIFELVPHHNPGHKGSSQGTSPIPYVLTVAAVDGAVSLRSTRDARPPILIGALDADPTMRPILREYASFDMTRDGWLGRDW